MPTSLEKRRSYRRRTARSLCRKKEGKKCLRLKGCKPTRKTMKRKSYCRKSKKHVVKGGGEDFDDAKYITDNKLITQSLTKLVEKKNNTDSTSTPNNLYVVTYKRLVTFPGGRLTPEVTYTLDQSYLLTIIKIKEYIHPNNKDTTPEEVKAEEVKTAEVKTAEVKTAELLAAKVKTAELLAAELVVKSHYKIYIIICKGDNQISYAIFFIKGDGTQKQKVSDELTDLGWLQQSNMSNNDKVEYYNDDKYLVYQYHTEPPHRLMSIPSDPEHILATLAPKKKKVFGLF